MDMWKEIPFTNGEYLISQSGVVKTAKTGRVLKPIIDARGYERVCLFKTNMDKRYRVHRLVAITFIPNPDNKTQVNHKDGNKRNNSIENLEWVTNEENMHHSRENGLHEGHRQFCENKKKRVIATNVNTGESIVFDSIIAARKALNTCHVQEVLKGIRYMTKGYTFRYEGGDA